MGKYNRFAPIKLEDTVILSNDPGDVVYNVLVENNITNIEELFIKHDNNMINYTNLPSNYRYQVIGTIKLLRYKYLGEDLDLLDILDGEIYYYNNQATLIKASGQKEPRINIVNYLQYLGLDLSLASMLASDAEDDITLINYIKRVYSELKGTGLCNASIEKLRLIIEWYSIKKNTINITITRSEVQEKLRELYANVKMLQDEQAEVLKRIELLNEQINYYKRLEEQAIKRERKI